MVKSNRYEIRETTFKESAKHGFVKQDIDQNQSVTRRRSTRDSMDKSEIILRLVISEPGFEIS